MCNPAQELDNAFSTVTGWVDQTLSGIGKTLDAISKDPLPTIATIALTAVGVPPVVTSLVRTAMTGGSMEDMVIGMATSYIGGQIGAAAGDLAFPELGGIAGYGGAGDLAFQPTATDAILKSVISNASAQGATAILQGKDLDQVFNSALTGAVGGLINTSLRTEFGLDPSKFGDKLIGDATKAAVSSIFTGKDPGEAIGNALSKSAFGSLANAAASGLKSTFKDLQDSSKEFETTKTEADGLRAEIGTESTRLSGLAGELNSTSTALNSRQTNLVEAQGLLNLASDAYNGYFNYYNPAAQNAFAQRMGYELVDDGEGGKAWAKNVKYVRNEYYDSEGQRQAYKLIFTPEGEIDYNAKIPTSFELVNIGTEAQNIANQQTTYLNNNLPQFKTDVEKFNTNLAKFNTDKSELDTKVTTYTGLVNNLFGEDGKGGLNKKIEDLLVARDGYLEDLDESLTSLTEAAGEKISGVAKEIADNAVDLLDQNYRSSDEVATAFAGLGYTPSAAEIARFVGEGDDATLSELLGVHVDQNSVDMEEARAAFQGTGYTPTDEELKQFIGQRAESGLEKDAAAFADPRVFDINEVKALAQAEGIELRARDILNLQKRGLIGVGDEVTLRNQLGAEFDNQFVTKNEARQYFQDLGYEVSEDDLNQFVGQRDESNTAATISNWVDERTVTRDEAEQAFKSVGYEPTEEELSRFLGNQSEKQVLDDIAEFGKERLRVTPPSPDKVLGEDGAAIPPSGSVAEYASAATSDVPAQDISISQLPETMRPREGETVTDATYGPEGEVRVTMVGKRPDGTEYSYTAVQDPEDKSVFYETASGGEAGGTTSSSDTRPGVAEKPAENIVIEGTDGSTVTLSPDGSVVNVTDADGTMPDNASDAQDVIDRVIANPVIETPVVAPPVVEPSYTPGEDAQEFEPPVVEQPAVEQPVVEPSVVAPPVVEPPVVEPPVVEKPVETVEGGTGTDLGGGDDTKAGNIVITGEDGSTVTLSPDGSVVDATDPDGSTSSDVQDVLDRVIANPVNIDTLEGAPGNDTFVGGEGDNTLVGGEGNDTFVIGGDDTLIGGEGNDTFVGDGENTLDGGVATTEGGEGNDTFTGAVGNDTFTAGGDDSLGGETDEDILDKLFGDDTFVGGDGNDTVTYDDTLDGGEGNDTVTDVETLEGGDGNDSLDGDKEVEPEPTFTCPEGFTYDYELGACMPDVPVEEEPELPDDTVPTCPEGYTYDYETGTCVPDLPVEEKPKEVVPDIPVEEKPKEPDTPPTCPEGYTYDAALGACVLEQEPPEVPSCPEGFVYDYELGACVPEVTEPPEPKVIECEEGYIYDPVQGICVPETIVTPPVVTPPVVTPPVVTPPVVTPPQPPRPPQPPPPPPPQTGGQDWLGLLGMLGMLQNQKRQQPPQAPAKEPEEYTYWEQLGSPYSPDEQMTTDDLIKMLRG